MATQTISFTITGTLTDLNQALDDFVYELGYQDNINGQSNPESKLDFFKRMIREYARDIIKIHRAKLAVTPARIAAMAEVDSELSFT